MKTHIAKRALRGFALASMVVSSMACGGGAGGSVAGGGGSGGIDDSRSSSTATFHVDVETGAVTVTPNKPASRAVFAGSAVGFNSATLLDQPGNVGIKTLAVSMTNNWGLPIGASPNGTTGGLKVIFGGFSNVSAFSDLRPRTTVSTYAGNGTAAVANGSLQSASFNGPTGIVAVGGGVFYVCDKAGNTIRKISGGNVSVLAGSTSSGSTNGQGATARFNFPFGIAYNSVDSALYVTDLLNNMVRRITADGRVTKVAGSTTPGGADGTGTSATFNGPTGIAVDTNGNVYVTEIYGQRVRKIAYTGNDRTSSNSYTVSTLAGSGTAGNADGFGTSATFNNPTGLTAAPDGSLYVCEQVSNLVRRVSSVGEVTTIAGTTVAGSSDGPGNTATFNAPRGLVYSRGALFVTDRVGNRIRQLTLNEGASPAAASSWTVATLAGNGGGGFANGAGNVAQINQPQMIAADPSGNLFVPDLGNKIREIVPSSGSLPIGTPGGSTPGEPVQLSNPDGIIPQTESGANVPYILYPQALDSGETSSVKNWWFAVPEGVTSFEFTVTVEATTSGLVPPSSVSNAGSPDVSVRTLAGVTNSTGFSDGTAEARMGLIKYNDIDGAGNVYFTDLSNFALRRITPQGRVTTIAGGPGNNATAADGSGTTAKISSINALAVKPDGLTVFFGDGNLVRVATCPDYLDSSNAGNWTITTLGGTTSAGNADNTLLTSASFNTIEDMAVTASGDLYLSEFFGNRVRKLTYKGSSVTSGNSFYVTTAAGDNSATNGAGGSTDSTGTSARLNNPRGIAVDRSGNVYVADQGNFKIRKISPLNAVTTVAGTGVQGYADGDTATAKFSLAYGICVDSSGYVYVGDIGTFTIRKISPSGVVSTVAGTNGVSGGLDGLGNVATFVRPAGVSVAPSGDLYICDQSSLRLVQRLISAGTR
jgi:hypothetical protein